MKIVIGIGSDPAENARTLSFLNALQLKPAQVSLVHVVDRFSGWDVAAGAADLAINSGFGQYWEQQRSIGNDLLKQAALLVKAFQGVTQTHLLEGQTSNELISFASKVNADLLVVGSSEKDPVEAVLIGSVGRKLLLNSDRSVLIAKEAAKGEGQELKAVFATDHSRHADSCFMELLSFPGLHFARLLALHVIDKKSRSYFKALRPSSGADKDERLESYLNERNKTFIQKLSALASEKSECIVHGKVAERLDEVMKDGCYDLAVIAAQGHGFMHRLVLGSTAMTLAATQKKSILVLRNSQTLA